MPTKKTDTKNRKPDETLANSELDEKAEAKQKNFQKRLEVMKSGLDDLENWLSDTIRQGIATLEQQPFSFWKEISERMVDSKLGGIGKRFTLLPVLMSTSEHWAEKVLEEFGAYYLMIRGLKNLESLPENLQYDLLSFAGVTFKKEEILNQNTSIQDTWLVIGQLHGLENKLNFRRTWIYGWKSGKYGLVLDFSWGNNPYNENYQSGQVFEAETAFYPSNAPIRITVGEKKVLPNTVKRIIGFKTFNGFLDHYTAYLAANPLQFFFPCALEQVTPILYGVEFFLLDSENKRIPVLNLEEKKWKILALSGGNPVHIFGEWMSDCLNPLSLSIQDVFYEL